MMKLIHLTEEKKPNPRDRIPYWRNIRWWGTFAMFLIGYHKSVDISSYCYHSHGFERAVMDFGSLGLLPASLGMGFLPLRSASTVAIY
jgi:hypothetical protein